MSKRKYISIVYDEKSQLKLRAWCKENGFDLSYDENGIKKEESVAFQFHTTLFYTKNEIQIDNYQINVEKIKSGNFSVSFVDFILLSPNIPAFIVDSDFISDMRSHFLTNYEIEEFYETYIPHISLSYKEEDYSLKEFTFPSFTMNAKIIKVEDLDESL